MVLIEHSSQLNDFLSFYIETRVNGVLIYETVIDYFQCQYTIVNLHTKAELTHSFDKDKAEPLIEAEIKEKVEGMIKASNQIQLLP